MIDPQLLETFVPLDSLSAGNRNKLAQRLDLLSAKAGELLFKVGDPGAVTIYLVEGTVRLSDDMSRSVFVRSGETTASHPLSAAAIRTVEARCVTDCRYLAIDRELLDVMLTWDQGRGLDVGDAATPGADDEDWMIRLLQMPIFHRVPPSHLYGMFRCMEAITAEAGQVLVRQDDPGDFFYVIIEGQATVTRRSPGGPQIVLAELQSGACFGEEALISQEPRNATVTMRGPSRLMRLSKANFQELLSEPLARTITYAEGSERVLLGTAQWLDVRLPAEYRTGSLSRSVNIPLHLLRLKIGQLDPNKTYLTICDTGRRSSVAAWLLNQRGFEAYRLDTGLPADV